jgi:hypothetical protein
MQMFGTRLAMSTAFHPETDGQTEWTNQTMETILRAITKLDPATWDLKLGMAEFAFNNTTSVATGTSPFFANYGHHPLTPNRADINISVPRASTFHHNIVTIHEEIRQHLDKTNRQMARQANKHRRDALFKEADWVLLDSANLRLPQDNKLRPRFVGPFQVDKMVTPVSYRLKLPQAWKVHPTFHVSLLRAYHDPNERFSNRPRQPPPTFLAGEEPDYVVEKILEHRVKTQRGRPRLDFRVTWLGHFPEDMSWIPEDQLNNPHALQAYLRKHGAADIAILRGG